MRQINIINRPVPTVIFTIVLGLIVNTVAAAQSREVVLSPVTMTVDSEIFVYAVDKDQADLRNFSFQTAGIVGAADYGNKVLIRGKRVGVTWVHFSDTAHDKVYRVRVTVNPKPVPPTTPASGGEIFGDTGADANGNPPPDEITDKAPFGKPTRQPLPNGGSKEIYKNKAGQVVMEREFDKGGNLVEEKNVESVHENGKQAEVHFVNAKGEIREVTYDPNGNIRIIENYKDLNEFGQATTKEVTENGKTTVFKRDPKTDKWIEQKGPNNANGAQKDKNAGNANHGLDPCLIGAWRSQTAYLFSDQRQDFGYEGIMIMFEGNGSIRTDYSKMQPRVDGAGVRTVWSGVGSGTISTVNQKATVSNASGIITSTITMQGNTRTSSLAGLGPAGIGNPPDGSYTCDATTLRFQSYALVFVFKRVGAIRP